MENKPTIEVQPIIKKVFQAQGNRPFSAMSNTGETYISWPKDQIQRLSEIKEGMIAKLKVLQETKIYNNKRQYTIIEVLEVPKKEIKSRFSTNTQQRTTQVIIKEGQKGTGKAIVEVINLPPFPTPLSADQRIAFFKQAREEIAQAMLLPSKAIMADSPAVIALFNAKLIEFEQDFKIKLAIRQEAVSISNIQRVERSKGINGV